MVDLAYKWWLELFFFLLFFGGGGGFVGCSPTGALQLLGSSGFELYGLRH